VAEDNAGQRLDFEIQDRFALRLGKVADLGLGKIEIDAFLPGEAVDTGLDLAVIQPVAGAVETIELNAQPAERGVPGVTHLCEQLFDGRGNRGTAGRVLLNARSFVVTDHGASLS
jgi:hypothetical protein